ncbi:MAG: YbaB/EbfC family nucleoid-associated protein [Candidatus Pacebacteria bacterium]|nr:YbaB/EbfC family nucleoid-associated protein [Candidatus Paceibacterota bacterium]
MVFDKLKQLNQIREIQKNLEKETAESEKQGVKVVLNGKMEIEEVVLNHDLPIEKQQELVKDCHNEAIKKIQVILAKQMQNFPGFGM